MRIVKQTCCFYLFIALLCSLICCTYPSIGTCEDGEFHCSSGNDYEIICTEEVCDGWIDCTWAEDEDYCLNYTCLPGYWKCGDNLQHIRAIIHTINAPDSIAFHGSMCATRE